MAEVYNKMKKKSELIKLCKIRGISGYSNLVKDRLIDLILTYEEPSQINKKRKFNNTSGPEKLILAHTYENQNIIVYMIEKIDGIKKASGMVKDFGLEPVKK